MAKGRPKAGLVLSDEEREGLLRLARLRKTAQAIALRSRIVLECAGGMTNTGWPSSWASRMSRLVNGDSVLWSDGWTD
jgi:hypothetical protein